MAKTKKSSQHELNLEDNQNNNIKKKEEYFEINLDTFLFNAGVIGFIEVLEKSEAHKGTSLDDKKDFYYEGQTLYINKKFLLNADLSQIYIDAMIKKFSDKTNISESIKKIDIILNDKENKDFKDDIKNIIDYFSAASIKTGLETLISKGISVNIQDNIEKIKEIIKSKNPNTEHIKNYLKEIKSDFENSKEVRDTLLMKNIMYTKINPFWENKAFLLPANSKKDIKEMFYKSFEEPLKELINNKKKFNYNCIVCNESINKDIDTTFLFEVGVDTNRKKSAFWNYNADSFICALCNYIYACTPLGFIDMSNLMLFVNQNDSIETLIKMNEKIDFVNNEDNKTYTAYNEIIRRILSEKTKELKSIQVIVRDKNHYLFNTIGKDSLQIIESMKDELNDIAKIKSIKITDDYWIDIYKDCLENILNFKNQWNLIFKLLKIEDNKFILNTIFNILKIQIAKDIIFLKEDNNMQKQFDLAYIAYKNGNEIRAKLIGANSSANLNSEQNKEADNKLRGLVYQLINYVHTSNRDLFLSNITRLYAGMNLSIPSIFLNIFKSDEEFKVIGNAYILGLKGSFYDNENSKNNDKKDN
ncbi:Cas8a1 family CRISPR/Cas system-associated protein [Brachyspira murdochii]|uniref:CRISPR-associated protein, CXXC-CXXC region n=1 Tax=Brachyspira murdochii (strain ATCC 51284 / DSM 12563 / 56-150) TaxID=526224 RepID=D5U9E6_BRAM5|nr:Cas8a1 family CRISPR/Cas system-associated protein [Brachyspira murdochii]ADG71319.1 CRISPR-associated protein, CXXC-CXXC region [Brachyspira murdochii DSM 12563]